MHKWFLQTSSVQTRCCVLANLTICVRSTAQDLAMTVRYQCSLLHSLTQMARQVCRSSVAPKGRPEVSLSLVAAAIGSHDDLERGHQLPCTPGFAVQPDFDAIYGQAIGTMKDSVTRLISYPNRRRQAESTS